LVYAQLVIDELPLETRLAVQTQTRQGRRNTRAGCSAKTGTVRWRQERAPSEVPGLAPAPWGTEIAPAADILKRDVWGAPKIDPGAVP